MKDEFKDQVWPQRVKDEANRILANVHYAKYAETKQLIANLVNLLLKMERP